MTRNRAVWTGSAWKFPVGNAVTPPPDSTDSFVMDVTMPNASNTGPAVLGYSNPSILNGDLTVTDGMLITNRLVNGHVIVMPGGIFRGNIVRGSTTPMVYPGKSALVTVAAGGSSSKRAVVEFNDIGYTTPHHVAMNCVWVLGPGQVTRNNIHDGTDIFDLRGDGGGTAGSDISGNYCHDLSYNSSDPDQGGGETHNDILQAYGTPTSQACLNYYFHGNNCRAYPSATTSIGTPTHSQYGSGVTISGTTPTTGMVITKNWFSGGDSICQANGYVAAQGSTPIGEFSYNRSSWDQWDYGFGDGPHYQIRHATAYTRWINDTTNYFDGSLPGVAAAGLSGQTFVVGTNGRAGIRIP